MGVVLYWSLGHSNASFLAAFILALKEGSQALISVSGTCPESTAGGRFDGGIGQLGS